MASKSGNTRRAAQLIADRTGLGRDICERVMLELVEVIIEELTLKREIKLGTLGKFYRKQVGLRNFEMPNGTRVTTPRKHVVAFRALNARRVID